MTDDNGQLLPEWRKLVMQFADRFMVGSDPVWPVDRLNPWDEPDTGWQELHRFVDFHRGWLDDLPIEAAHLIRSENARQFFRLARTDKTQQHWKSSRTAAAKP